jgi:hypothetical protein
MLIAATFEMCFSKTIVLSTISSNTRSFIQRSHTHTCNETNTLSCSAHKKLSHFSSVSGHEELHIIFIFFVAGVGGLGKSKNGQVLSEVFFLEFTGAVFQQVTCQDYNCAALFLSMLIFIDNCGQCDLGSSKSTTDLPSPARIERCVIPPRSIPTGPQLGPAETGEKTEGNSSEFWIPARSPNQSGYFCQCCQALVTRAFLPVITRLKILTCTIFLLRLLTWLHRAS